MAAPPGRLRPRPLPASCTLQSRRAPGEESVQAWASRGASRGPAVQVIGPVTNSRNSRRTDLFKTFCEIPKISAYFEPPWMWAVYVPKPLRDRNDVGTPQRADFI